MARAYRQLAVPRVLMDRVQALMDNFPELGYRTPSEAAIEGLRWWIGVLEDRAERLLAARGRQSPPASRPSPARKRAPPSP